MSQTIVVMLAALAGELVLLALVLLTLSWWRTRAARRRDAAALRTLVRNIRQGQGERAAVIEGFLRDAIGLSDATLAEVKAGMLHAELGALQRFVTLYRRRDAAAVAQFHTDLYAVVAPYHLLQSLAPAMPQQASDGAADGADFGALRDENRRLSEELKTTMETMSRMLNEYSTMFAGGAAAERGGEPGPAVVDDPAAVGQDAAATTGDEAPPTADLAAVADLLDDMDPADPVEPPVVAHAAAAEDAGEVDIVVDTPSAPAVTADTAQTEDRQAAEADVEALFDNPAERTG